MSNDVVIRVEHLSKRYVIKHAATGDRSGEGLRHLLHDASSAPFRLLKRRFGGRTQPSTCRSYADSTEEFWALNDVSFEVRSGEVLGIIGRNGAGKSTLLKILSRITEPSTGRIGIKGRVASLLEVGTGFHPELTGRENIFLNGAILGMARSEVKSKFDEIVAFAEVEQFLDTPVKKYSSGMYVRLAFAVAAHLEPEILVVDEVLAVGDDQFQKKCLGKMQAVSDSGKTVIVVSHNMGSVARMCNTAMQLQSGRLVMIGDTSSVLSSYMRSGTGTGEWVRPNHQPATGAIYLYSMSAFSDGSAREEIPFDADVTLRCRVIVDKPLRQAKIGITLQDCFQHYIATTIEHLSRFDSDEGAIQCEVVLPKCFVVPGNYSFRVALFESLADVHDVVDVACRIKIVDTGSRMSGYEGIRYGDVVLPFKWRTCSSSALALA